MPKPARRPVVGIIGNSYLMNDRYAAVSYTHLDVYKRQSLAHGRAFSP